ncbi:hypothetical protein Q5424_09325 [Conexibacter sp. JD483]|uniref:hypothetical protein n=1 Tax=unclassified Conexibacter TaxID=2627773 RepID=UPI0027282992|nr:MULTISPECIES: hypothetical protein [unclassified Conexibacter]MDO8187223.1 hypothetical protein [Conexibacter sp. CPCC 205706]MDO8199320.1 hypothetical protein [Conexibacter sp. CPCC 205762]MDR9369279.1 hypothetical protein [Conexibacter sp. JD483]
MPVRPSTRLQLHAPASTDRVDVPSDLLRLRDQLDVAVAVFAQGGASVRPAAGVVGRFHFATDTGRLSYDTGVTWIPLVLVV